MSVSKRTRFEVLRRDNHTCRYCGGIAPDVVLVVDHVTPVALGGTDDPSNLVAACRDCNAGKASTSPEEHTVADVASDALRWAAAIQRAADDAVSRQDWADSIIHRFTAVWTDRQVYERAPVPDGWEDSILTFIQAGLNERLIHRAILKAFDARQVPKSDKFRYMCGICWRQIAELQAAAKAELAEPVA